jgi:hypothetical protein
MHMSARTLGTIAVIAATLALAAPVSCTPGPHVVTADDATGLHVEMGVVAMRVARVADLRTTVTLTNRGAAPRRLRVEYVAAGNLSLDVYDATGQRLPPLSPPVPHVDDGVTGWATLAPGQSRSFDVSSGIGVDVPDGRYRVRFAGVPADPTAGELKTDWVTFEVGR